MAKETDFIPVYERVVRTDGTVINKNNGLQTDGSSNVNILGRGALEQTFWNAQAIRDTALATSPILTLQNISGENFLLINNTLDQAVTVNVYIKNTLGQIFPIFTGLSIPATNGQKILTRNDHPIMCAPVYQMYMTAQCSTAPTTGGFSATIGGTQA
ncbi:hypothetical protein ABE288_22530 [Bacillus salipaludis]|uniref:hypothetical protein n=1 Tax=Bacillus salipaludis TaxID=2547811 RepID=UPI003D1CE543